MSTSISHAQNIQTIKIKKQQNVYFFQKGEVCDTIYKNKHHEFYFLLPDDMKRWAYLEVHNGQLVATENDSLLKMVYVPGLVYQTKYLFEEMKDELATYYQQKKKFEGKPVKSKDKPRVILETLINGTSDFPREKIRIRLLDRRQEGIVIENEFFVDPL